MKQETELVSKEDGLSADFKHKMSAWEENGVFDKMAGKIDKLLEDTGNQNQGGKSNEEMSMLR